MKSYQVERAIAAPQARVWRVLADVRQWHEWTASITRIDVLHGVLMGPGARVAIKQPKLPPNLWLVTEWRSGESFTWEARTPGLHIVASHTLVRDGEGCRVRLALTLDGFLSGVAGFLTGKLTQRYLQMEADGLKARSESEPEPGPHLLLA